MTPDSIAIERPALLAGATGLVGDACLRLLLEEPRYGRIWAPTRRPLPTHPKLAQLPGDYERLPDLPEGLRGGDVFCCLGTTLRKAGGPAAFRLVDHDFVLALARRALEAGARQFLLVSSLGADPASRVLYSRVKGEAEAAVARLPFAAVHLLRPSLLLGPRAESRPGEFVARALAPLLAFALVGPLRKYRPIAAPAVARAMLRLALQREPGVHTVESDRLEELGGEAA